MNLRIKFRSENIDQFIERYAIDVSRGGIFIRTREPLAVGTVLRFDFQLQDGAPLMTGEGTVVWIREHDPTRTGVTPGMGVRFDKLTPTSQPVLDKILLDKSRREQSGLSGLSVPGAASKGGAGMAVRRPSSMFSAVDPATLGPGLPASLGGSGAAPLPGSMGGGSQPHGQPISSGSTLPFGSAAHGAETSGAKPLMSTTPGQPVPPPLVARTPPPLPVAPPAGTPPVPPARAGAGALPTSETQSALGRLSTGNLAAYGAPAAGGSSSVGRLTPSGRGTSPPMAAVAEAVAKGPAVVRSTTGSMPVAPASPDALVTDEESERTQIAEGLPDFANETTRVGGPPLPVSAPRSTGTHPKVGSGPQAVADGMGGSTAEPSSKMSLDRSVASIDVGRLPNPSRTATPMRDGGLPELPPRAKTPVPATVREISRDGHPGVTRSTAGSMAAARPASQGATAPAPAKRKTVGYVIAGVLAGTLVAVIVGTRMMGGEAGGPAPAAEPAVPQAVAVPPPAAAPPPAPATAKPDETAAAATAPAAAAPSPAAAQAADEAKAAAAAAEPKPAAEPAAAPAGPAAPAAKSADEPKPPAVAEVAPPAAAPAAKAGPTGRKHAGGHKRNVAAASKGEGEAAAADATAPPPAAGPPAAEAAPTPPAAEAAPAAAAPAADAGPARIVKITSTPSGAEVLVDGRTVGKTPYQGKDIDPSSPHALTVKRDGFETYEHMISGSDWLKVKGVPSLKVTVKLRKARGAASEGDGAKPESKPAEGAPGEAPAAKQEAPAANDVP